MLKLFAPGQRVFVCGSSNEPTALLSHLAQLALPDNLEFVQFPIAGLNSTDFTAWNESACITSFFMTPTLAKADAARVQFLPMQMRYVYDYLSQNIDVALLQVARDAQGELRLGPNVDFVEAALASAKVVIAELNHGLVAPAGCPKINASRIDYLFESERQLLEMPAPKIDESTTTIGRLVARLIADGDCIQTGIGAIPATILKQLGDKNDLGLHSGIIDDGCMRLILQGNMNGDCKSIDRRRHVTGGSLCSRAMHDVLVDRPDVVFRATNYTHELGTIRQLSNFVSVNSAVEIDLWGQVNAEYAGGRQISGTGGSVDFMRAAKVSSGGRSIIAMTATARGGTVSRIVPKVELVTALRTDVDIVVTEFGVARVKHLPLRERALALIDVAAPQFREELRAAWHAYA